MLRKTSIFGIICAGIALLPPAFSKPGFPRHPLCNLNQAKSQEINKLETAFRSEFCKTPTSGSCNDRWNNGKLFLEKALADTRITDVGTISYMFGTIYAETGIKNFSPSTTEVIGSKNRNEGYVKEGFYGRGWVQLTHKNKYEVASRVLHKDFIKNPDLVLEPDNAYEILFRGMRDGWIEVYRTSVNGSVSREVPIKLGDFVNSKEVNYDLARAVINANCKKISGKCAPSNIEYRKGLFIPPAESLNAGSKAAMAAEKMEHILCQISIGKK
ncbi:glycoside hydrolase family 19 protein [Herbaspirillum sp. SJZ107]|uniref:glycoside hydrolase family 19 protein n=1 Tax=Herbaspirillum sp. SJZ107 TaxID=2572881 RepID=UPI0011527D08|nr:glycoside hydrolase family 19 protein [Herbaspirillum sp. SJZ107]TQK10999.1 chitinase class I [Herbaspirillum sp. SJZ107]